MILVTGAGGQVGTELLARAAQHGHDVTGLVRADLDISDAAAVQAAVAKIKPSLIVNAAAYTAVDKAEEDRDAAYAINRDGPANLAAAAKAAGIPLIHISTDYVFDGSKDGAYLESDPVAPLGVYGASKEAGEQAVRDALDEHAILRTSWVYAAHGATFVKTMLRLMRERDSLNVVDDQIGTPCSTQSLVSCLHAVIERNEPGAIYHWTDAGVASWYDFAVAIQDEAIRFALLDHAIPIHPISTEKYKTAAARPAYSVLDKSKALLELQCPQLHWREALRDTLRSLSEK